MQQILKIRQGRRRNARCPEVQARTGDGIKHPCGYDREYPRMNLDMDKLSGCAAINALDPQLTAKKRVPAVMHHNNLPDMGRMNGRWL